MTEKRNERVPDSVIFDLLLLLLLPFMYRTIYIVAMTDYCKVIIQRDV